MVLHHVRHEVLEGRWGGAGNPRGAALKIFAKTVEDLEAALERDHVTAGLVPLRVSVGRRHWKSSKMSLARWAANVSATGTTEPPHALTLGRSLALSAPGKATRVVTGSEQALANVELRLAGRPDWFAHVGDGRIEVVDFKSARVTDSDGQLLDHHVVQLQLYTLMLEAAFPGVWVTPFVEHVARIEVPWGDRERIRLRKRLRDVASALPAGAYFEAGDLARPGVHCGTCRLRPRCPAYLTAAPGWWSDRPESPRPLPLDVWGYVQRVQIDQQSVAVRLLDASGRHVHVYGVHRSQGAAGLRRGDAAWFFDLEASEDLQQHGALIQPRNFHERAPGPRWRSARKMRLFSKPRSKAKTPRQTN